MGRGDKLARLEAEVPGGRIAKKKKAEIYGTAGTYKGVPVTQEDRDLIERIRKRREQLRKKRGVSTAY